MRGGIYSIKCSANGRVYIGQSRNVRERFSQHRCKLRHGQHPNPHLQSAWRKYGESAFSFEILAWEDNPHERDQREDALFQSLQEQSVMLFNIRPATATNKGVEFSTITRAKISAKARKQFATAEGRARHSRSYHPDGQSHTLLGPGGARQQIDNPAEFARVHNLDLSNVHKLLKGKLYTYRGWSNPEIDQSAKMSNKLTTQQKTEAFRRYEAGEIASDIAQSLNVSASALTGLLKRHRVMGGRAKQTLDRANEGRRLHREGLTPSAIAALVGVDVSTVRRWLKG